ncbi:MAG: glucosaminidase domain-containing protein [Thiotrichaceae bacterium]|nr:glucosaminidase domain-containing protein [Thiotrichaceae bacterium]
MSLPQFSGFIFSSRLPATALLLWGLFSTQAMAWQQVSYNPYPVYAAPVNYNPYAQPYARPYGYPVYNYPAKNYPRYGYPQQNYYTPQFVPAKLTKPAVKPDIKTVPKQKKAITQSNNSSKKIFIEKLIPYIDKENTRLKQTRKQLWKINQQLDSGTTLTEKSQSWIKKIAKKYRVKGNPLTKPQARKELLSKVDIIPSSLTLAQAANESAWGKSRFATEANNLFGIWTYDESKGLKPKNRDPEKKHLVRIFDHYGESVSYYMHTLNSHPAYKKLRDIRQQQRQNELILDGFEMADGLEKYSAKGDLYIKLIQQLILQNKWAQLDGSNQSVSTS